MTRKRGHGHKKSKKASGSNAKLKKQNQLVLEAVVTTKHCKVVQTPERSETIDCEKLPSPGIVSIESFLRLSPLFPRWKDSDEVRLQMFGHDLNYKRSKNFMMKHPNLEQQMRSILLDWLIEVCEAYALHRQTFYLAQDYFDRFMMTQSNVQKEMLQLIGITCLFIAAKMEETRPPKLRQMVYVTADTYNEKLIIEMELIILKNLHWQLSPETAVSWMNLFLQLVTRSPKADLLERHFPVDIYLQMARLLDLCIISFNALDFRYEVLAASVLAFFIPQEMVELVTDLPTHIIQPCVNWMAPFAQSAALFGREKPKNFKQMIIEDKHTIQTHSDYLTMMDNAIQEETLGQLPTPPSSTEEMDPL